MVILKSLLSLLRTIAFLPLLYVSNVSADIVLLIHGFDNHAMTWEQSGINQYLHQQGWYYQGILNDNGHSIVLQPSGAGVSLGQSKHNDNKLYTVNLASRAPVEYQSQQLRNMIHWLNQIHPAEPIYLVGHSAGGLVARYTIVQLFQQQPHNQHPGQIAGLISIAAPHLGTFRAAQAIDEFDEPFFCPGPGWRILQSVFGGYEYDLVKESKGLLYELYPSRPYNLTFWLNEQPHPNIPYFSVVRASGDFMVPGYSQDMNNVPALKNQSITMLSNTDHFLTPQDAVTIHSILASLTGTL